MDALRRLYEIGDQLYRTSTDLSEVLAAVQQELPEISRESRNHRRDIQAVAETSGGRPETGAFASRTWVRCRGTLASRSSFPTRELYASSMAVDADRTAGLREFASQYEQEGIAVLRAHVATDIRQDGEPVTRVLLLLSDPTGETWDLERVRDLRASLGRRAMELGLPPISMTLVAEGDPEAAEAFAQ